MTFQQIQKYEEGANRVSCRRWRSPSCIFPTMQEATKPGCSINSISEASKKYGVSFLHFRRSKVRTNGVSPSLSWKDGGRCRSVTSCRRETYDRGDRQDFHVSAWKAKDTSCISSASREAAVRARPVLAGLLNLIENEHAPVMRTPCSRSSQRYRDRPASITPSGAAAGTGSQAVPNDRQRSLGPSLSRAELP
jgi:hypothetical protein